MNGYKRQEIHINAPKPSGRVGLLVKACLYHEYEVSVIDRSFDGIPGVKFLHRNTDYEILLCSRVICHLKVRGRRHLEFLCTFIVANIH